MQLQPPERDAQHELEAFRHVAFARVRREGVVAEVGALEEAADDFADVEHADDRVVLAAAHDEADVRGGGRVARGRGAVPVHERRVARGRRRRVHPRAVQPAARLHGGEKARGVRLAAGGRR